MVVINSQSAQLANRLWGFSAFIANSIEYNYPLVNLGFFKYRKYFKATASNNFGSYPISISRTGIPFLDYFYSNLFKNWATLSYRKFGKTPTIGRFYQTTFNEDLTATVFDLNRKDFVHDAQNRKTLVQGWMFRDPVNVRKHRAQLLDFFTPVEPYKSEVVHEIEIARKLADVLIGVHIRRGDYATFADGKWYYTDKQYAEKMHQVVTAYQEKGMSCAFFVCSNEPLDANQYQGLTLAYKERHFMVDLYALAACDAIIGPPSTFSQWAAFYGDKALTMIVHADQELGIPVYNPSLLPDFDFPEKELYRF